MATYVSESKYSIRAYSFIDLWLSSLCAFLPPFQQCSPSPRVHLTRTVQAIYKFEGSKRILAKAYNRAWAGGIFCFTYLFFKYSYIIYAYITEVVGIRERIYCYIDEEFILVSSLYE